MHTYIFDLLYKWISPLEDNKEKLIGLLLWRPLVDILHHIGLKQIWMINQIFSICGSNVIF